LIDVYKINLISLSLHMMYSTLCGRMFK